MRVGEGGAYRAAQRHRKHFAKGSKAMHTAGTAYTRTEGIGEDWGGGEGGEEKYRRPVRPPADVGTCS